MPERTLEQLRAANALAKVRSVESTTSAAAFASYVASLAPSILNNGLGQSCASLLARAKDRVDDPYHLLYQALQDWLCRDANDAPYPPGDLMAALTGGDRYTYLRAQAEALAWLEWLKRFSAAYLKPEGPEAP